MKEIDWIVTPALVAFVTSIITVQVFEATRRTKEVIFRISAYCMKNIAALTNLRTCPESKRAMMAEHLFAMSADLRAAHGCVIAHRRDYASWLFGLPSYDRIDRACCQLNRLGGAVVNPIKPEEQCPTAVLQIIKEIEKGIGMKCDQFKI